ncbi:Ig-like domain-containing protein, partial [Psychromonas sp. SP041]|uniref:VCBS domain-containing protein n=1 Tax=Psychromonas sp. SP041 TaxID=1365007 RepID=UPI0010C78303
ATDNFNGVENISFTATDPEGESVTQAIVFTVNPVNDAPTLADVTTAITDTAAADSFDATTGTLTATDVDDSAFTYDFTDGTDTHVGTYGTLTLASDGSYSFTPNAAAIDALSSDTTETFTVRVTDSGGDTGIENALSDTATFTIDITAANDTPISSTSIADQTQSEDFADYSIDLKEYFSDAETVSADLVYSVAGNRDIGVTIVDGIATFTSATDNFNGVENISFTATDPEGESVTQAI